MERKRIRVDRRSSGRSGRERKGKRPGLGVFALVSVLVAACAVNPVTGKRELRLVSEASEIQIGAEGYFAAQQSQGGAYGLDPELAAYVAGIGRKMGEVSDRPELPWEFVVLNESIPNAWAMPGGKIAVNRGLLVALGSEAELAAVLGHEVVHAAARHSAKAIERGMLFQIGLVGLGVALGGESYADLAVGGAALAIGLANATYSRSQELEADLYGMRYMRRAGYDPGAAVDVQRTFVRLLEAEQPGWLLGLFASHPPSQERVEANQATAAELAEGGVVGREVYAEKLTGLRRVAPAYEALDEGQKALADGDPRRALALANRAIDVEPREARFYGLRGDARTRLGKPREAVEDYGTAIARDDAFFRYYLQRGLLRLDLGERAGGEADLARSLELLPTAPAHYALGGLALTRGNRSVAVGHFRVAASSDSEVGERARVDLARLELPERPGDYVAARATVHGTTATVTVTNRSPITIRDVVVRVEAVDKKGRILATGTGHVSWAIAPGRSATTTVHLPLTREARGARATVRAAQVAR